MSSFKQKKLSAVIDKKTPKLSICFDRLLAWYDEQRSLNILLNRV